jgi:hypothetical protein
MFGFGKKKSEPVSSSLNLDGFGGLQNTNTATQGVGYTDPLTDQNSGLNLANLNNTQDNGLGGQQQGALDSFGNPRPQPRSENFEYSQHPAAQQQETSKDLQLILSKLDTIRSEITNINHRLDNIERHQQETPQKKYPW